MRISDYAWRDDYDWIEAFAYATFVMDDVDYVLARDEGANDFEDWIMVGRLKNEDYFFLTAGCDYTGWDCQADGQSFSDPSLSNLIRFSLGENDRRRLNLKLDYQDPNVESGNDKSNSH